LWFQGFNLPLSNVRERTKLANSTMNFGWGKEEIMGGIEVSAAELREA
jgi:hypothetical protein